LNLFNDDKVVQEWSDFILKLQTLEEPEWWELSVCFGIFQLICAYFYKKPRRPYQTKNVHGAAILCFACRRFYCFTPYLTGRRSRVINSTLFGA
jgi:hypothetical protein